jgi:hypothetical protein
MSDPLATRRYFVTYTGVRLPFRLVDELDESETDSRNTFLRADFDPHDRLLGFEKVVQGEVEMAHHYHYHGDGPTLARAEITNSDAEVTVLRFDASGRPGAEET